MKNLIYILMLSTLIMAKSIVLEVDMEKNGVVANDNKSDSDRIQKIINQLKRDKSYKLIFPKGTINLSDKIEINRGNVEIVGQGDRETVFLANFKKHVAYSIFSISGFRGVKKAKLKKSFMEKNKRDITFMPYDNLSAEYFENKDIIIEEKIKGRTEIMEINKMKYCFSEKNNIEIKNAGLLCSLEQRSRNAYSKKGQRSTMIYTPKFIKNVNLNNFKIVYLSRNYKPKPLDFTDKDSSTLVDSITISYGKWITVENIEIINSGRNPINTEFSRNLKINNIDIKGVINKGEENGNINISSTFDSEITNFNIKGLKLLKVNNSSAYNLFSKIRMENAIFLNGGRSHNNDFKNLTIIIDQGYPYSAITKNLSNETRYIIKNLENANNKFFYNTIEIKDYREIKF